MIKKVLVNVLNKIQIWALNKIVGLTDNQQKEIEVYSGVNSEQNYQIDHMQEQANCALQRERLYVRVLSDYVKHQRKVNRSQRWFKGIFFLVVCVAFGIVVCGCIASIIIISIKEKSGWSDLAVAVTSVVSLVSVVIVLPTKIADHLFPVAGEKDITEFIIKMHGMDTQIMDSNANQSEKKKNEKRDDMAFLKSALKYAKYSAERETNQQSENKSDQQAGQGEESKTEVHDEAGENGASACQPEDDLVALG